MDKKRCVWPGTKNQLMIDYHDKEWGIPQHDDQTLFEYIVLDTFQAGLSWEITLNKREGFKKAFANYNPKKISQFTKLEVEKLMQNPKIIRNRLKIEATITNAKAFLKIQKEHGSFDKYIWRFVNHKPIINKFKDHNKIPATSKESDEISKDLKKQGFKFVGSTICYAFMQGAGMVNDHLTNCFRYKEVLTPL